MTIIISPSTSDGANAGGCHVTEPSIEPFHFDQVEIAGALVAAAPAPCPKCGEERHYTKGGMRGGAVRLRLNCNACQRAAPRNLERRRAYEAKYRAQAGGAAAYNKIWERRNREKALAHKKVEAYLRHGTLVKQPCERCGATDLVHAHHDDYSKPAEVMWLCPLHHKERHRELEGRT